MIKNLIIALAVVLAATSCGAINPDPAETAQMGREQLERHQGNPDVAPVDIGLELGRTEATPAESNENKTEIFGSIGFTPTQFLYQFGIPEEMTDAQLLAAAGADIAARGGQLETDRAGYRVYRLQSMGDEVVIELRNLGTGVFVQTVSVRT